MTTKQIELARHALGLPNKRKRTYRNRFVAGDGHDDFPEWELMVAEGNAEKRDGSTVPFGGDHIYYLTEQGARLALKRGEKLSPEDFPQTEKSA